MARTFDFDDSEGKGKAGAGHCAACEEMLADALDACLSEAGQRWFDAHISTCASCSEMLADAQRGAAWLEMLKTPRPEPSARLMERILAQTSGNQTIGNQTLGNQTSGTQAGAREEITQQPHMVPAMAPSVPPPGVPGDLLEFRPRTENLPPWARMRSRRVMFEPRLAMTAAMAFFSIALTLNLTGVQLNKLHMSDLSPANLKHTYYAANAEAVRYYDNLRVVRVMESRVEDLREAAADRAQTPKQQPNQRQEVQPQTTPETPDAQPDENKKPVVEPGMSRQAAPISNPESPGAITEGIHRTGEPVASLRKVAQAGGLG